MTERGRLESRLTRAIATSQNFDKSRRTRHNAARRAAALAENLGLINRPSVCQACFHSSTLERHHPDYSNPIFVEFLCPDCHRQADADLSKERRP
jgi:transposase-like protein